MRAVITYLEMRAAPKRLSGPPPLPDTAIRRLEQPSATAYRFLYDGVGEPWLWHERRRLDEAGLKRIIHDPHLEILVLTCAGRVAGFAELDHRQPPACRLAYFGLLPDFIGRGLGFWFLSRTIAHAWNRHPGRLLVNTCTLDHPAAMPLYLRAGFTLIEHVVRDFPDPRLSGVLPRHAAPHVPLAVDGG